MKNWLSFIFFLFLGGSLLAQEVAYASSFDKHSTKNEFKVKSTFQGLEGAGFAKVKFYIPEDGRVAVPPGGSLTASGKGNILSFYAYSVPGNGVLQTVFTFETNQSLPAEIKVMLQYAKNNNRHDLTFESIIINEGVALGTYDEDYSEHTIDFDQGSEIASVSNSESTSTESTTELSSETETETEITNTETRSTQSSSSVTETEVTSTSPEGIATFTTTGNFSVQILSLTDYNSDRVNSFCRKHSLDKSKLVRREVNGVTKISIGKFTSREAAQEYKLKVVNDHGVPGPFVVKID